MNITPSPVAEARLPDASNQMEARAVMGIGGVQGYEGQPSGPELYPAARFQLPNPIPLGATGQLAPSFDYMMAHLNKPVRISTLSAIAGCSQSRFFELFKNVTGDSPLNWFNRARMRWAGELLESYDLPIKQVASLVGFEDPFYFSRLFKSVHGISPRDYRAQKEQPQAGRVRSKRVTDGAGLTHEIFRANPDGTAPPAWPRR